MRNTLFGIGRALRETGQAIDRVGMEMQGNLAFKEQLSRHRRIMPLEGLAPSVSVDCFVAPNASVIGDVTLGEKVCVWYGAVLRGDRAAISVGEGTCIGDRAVVHGAHQGPKGKQDVQIGNHVSVGEGAILHGCKVEEGSVIGAGAIIYDGSVIEKNAMISPGSVVTAGKTVPSGQVWSGVPAAYERNLSEEEIQAFKLQTTRAQELGMKHKEEHDKTEAQRQKDRDQDEFFKPEHNFYKETPF
uniref:Gama-carbonic anhydrase n=1 Tax=Pyropia yezoensis TaxID=2788 RepID=A0A8E8PH15_PYRYE|nr:gama-carbonic anhydrase [Neopyropia yezoensis]